MNITIKYISRIAFLILSWGEGKRKECQGFSPRQKYKVNVYSLAVAGLTSKIFALSVGLKA